MKRKIIFDLIHGYIEIDTNMESIINSESFQRLKFINQLTVQHLYPSSNHTRFEHSLGVMYLSIKFFNCIDSLLQKIIDGKPKDFFPTDIIFLKNHLKYAALLHDVGHSPLSHVGEHFYEKDKIIKNIEKNIIENALSINIEYLRTKGSSHEIMSCYVILHNYRKMFKEIFNDIDFEFIFRIIVGARYTKNNYPERNVIISIVNSDSFDVDKLDYLIT